jgi:hypothetical protein
MDYQAKLPPDFAEWPEAAQAHWIQQGPLTQREMLHLAAAELNLDVEIDGRGMLTNRDLGRFCAALLAEEGRR